ncbi:MAG: GntR family transcriptional regulator [Clostridiales bacterium]|nr:GntR family transcriptional regulator [Clostridiales bacterium]MDD7366356.1 GntR family transcriptional regulator [Clostridiales bacterium]
MEYKTISLADQVFERLEADILSGKYQRGEVITELRLCAELGVSRTPVREALRRLLQEHLIEESGKGTVVMGISRKDFEDMCAIRLRIEGLAVRGFIEHKTEESMRELKEALDFQEFYLARSDADHMKIMDGRFHEAIYNHCGSAILRDTLSPLHKKVQKYRRLSIEQSGRAAKSVEEHRAIYNAIEAGDADLAERLMAEHVNNAMHTIVDKEI